MKKEYITPASIAHKVDNSQIVCASPQMQFGVGNTENMRTRHQIIWDDEEDWE